MLAPERASNREADVRVYVQGTSDWASWRIALFLRLFADRVAPLRVFIAPQAHFPKRRAVSLWASRISAPPQKPMMALSRR